MNGNITTILNGSIESASSQTRWTQTNANLSVNGFLFDFKFTVPESYTNKWDFLKDTYVNITKRIGSGNGGSVALLSNCRLYDLLAYSDFKAGVSMKSTSFTSGEVARISGYVDIGFFSMNSRDALEVTLNIADKTKYPSSAVAFEISSVFDKIQITNYKTYQSTESTGADQPYKNVLEIAYVGSGVNADAVINDQIGNKSVNINSAIAKSNAQGEFEFFTDFGLIYEEPFGISEDLTMRVPTTNNPSLLVIGYTFYPEETESSYNDFEATREALLTQIKNNDTLKYQYLRLLGLA